MTVNLTDEQSLHFRTTCQTHTPPRFRETWTSVGLGEQLPRLLHFGGAEAKSVPDLARPWPRPGTEAPSDWTCGLHTARPFGITLQLYVPGRRASARCKQPKKPTAPQPRGHSNIRGPTPVRQMDARQAASHWGHEATVLERPPSLATPTSQGVTSATRAQITSVLRVTPLVPHEEPATTRWCHREKPEGLWAQGPARVLPKQPSH